jgi:rhodanese-related sulfurtransferase
MVHSISAAQALDLVSTGAVDVIDVRESHEWSGGHIPGARLVPLEQLRANAKAVLTKDSVLFVCAAGVRSQTAARIAASAGLKTIYNLSTGVRGWVKAGFELTQELGVAV